jgi:uncharacterized RDD family membrane protein YckC
MDSPDKLTIDTPEQTALEYPLAGIGSRFLALAADMAIQAVIALVVVILGALIGIGSAFFGSAAPQWVVAAVVVVLFLLNSGYFAFFETIWNGQTPGKRYAGLRVIKDDGRPITAYDAIARNLLRIVDSLPGIYGVGVLCVFFSKQSKRLGDYVAGTVVVHEKTLEGVRPFQESKIDESLPPIDASRISIDEVRLIETFLNRRDSLEVSVRTSMAMQIANRIGAKLEVKVYGWPRTERFLEAVMEQCRMSNRFRT